MTKNHRFWGHFGTHGEGFEKGPLHNTYMPDPLFLTCWDPCVFCGGHGRFLRILGVPKNPQKTVFFWVFFWNPFFSFFWEKASPKWSRNEVPFWNRGRSSSIINSCKISLFAPLDGGPFLGPRPRPLKIRRGSIFDVLWGPKKCETGVFFLGFFWGTKILCKMSRSINLPEFAGGGGGGGPPPHPSQARAGDMYIYTHVHVHYMCNIYKTVHVWYMWMTCGKLYMYGICEWHVDDMWKTHTPIGGFLYS